MNSSAPGRNETGRNEAGRSEVGRIEVITGPMFSGKSEELIRRLKRARTARQRVACFKLDIDLRYHRTSIASHSAQTHEAMTVANVARLREALYEQLPEVEAIGIDEAQFFDEAIVHLVGELAVAGAAGVYEARCRACFRPYLDAPESEQMELTGAMQMQDAP